MISRPVLVAAGDEKEKESHTRVTAVVERRRLHADRRRTTFVWTILRASDLYGEKVTVECLV